MARDEGIHQPEERVAQTVSHRRPLKRNGMGQREFVVEFESDRGPNRGAREVVGH
jgi:hypothetical protein